MQSTNDSARIASRPERLSTIAPLRRVALHDGPGQKRVDRDVDAGLGEHLEGDELVDFGVDGGADGVVVAAVQTFRRGRRCRRLSARRSMISWGMPLTTWRFCTPGKAFQRLKKL